MNVNNELKDKSKRSSLNVKEDKNKNVTRKSVIVSATAKVRPSQVRYFQYLKS